MKKGNRNPPKLAHTPKTKKGMGDYYGTGVKNPVGKVRDMTAGINPLDKKRLKSPPKSLA